MSKEKVLNEKLVEASLTLSQNEYKIMLSAMQEYADIESENKSLSFLEWMSAPGLHPEICSFMIPSKKYQYFIGNIYNK